MMPVFRIRIHWFRIRHFTIPIRIRIQYGSSVWWSNIDKNLQLKKKFDIFFLVNHCNLLIPRPPKRTSKLQEKSSALNREHPAIPNLKFINFSLFCGSFKPSWIRIHWPDWIRIRSGSGSETLPEAIQLGDRMQRLTFRLMEVGRWGGGAGL
jgi:hypothetical protein